MRTIGAIKIPDKDTYKVCSTFEYRRFKFIDGNRDVDHEKKIEESIRKVGLLLQPVLINELWEIIEGQNRFVACRNLGLPIYYIMQPGLRIEEVKSLNSASKNWAIRNYIHSYSHSADKKLDYVFLDQLLRAYPWAPQQAIIFAINNNVGYGGGGNANIKSGNFKCSQSQYDRAIEIMDFVEMFKEYIEGVNGKKTYFYIAIAYCYLDKYVDNEYLLKKFEKYHRRLKSCSSIIDALTQIEEQIYNYQLRTATTEPVSLKFDYECFLRSKKPKTEG